MNIFVLLRTQLEMCGIKIARKSWPFNMKNATVSFLLYLYVILNALTLNETSTFDEWIEILFRSVSIGICGIVHVIIVWKTSELFQFIDNLTNSVDKSEFVIQIRKSNDNSLFLILLVCFCTWQDWNVRNRKHFTPKPVKYWKS